MSNKFERWVDHKYGKVRAEHTWVKAHITTGVNTNVVTAVEIHDKNANDCPILPSLVATTKTNFDVKEISGDKQYASTVNFDVINSIGADAFIPFRSNAVADRVGDLYKKAFAFFMLYREDFLQSYHKRSNVESTFSMVKAKFGGSVRSKTEVAMKNEVLAKILCHNICCLISAFHELGIEPAFAA
jgi:transposase